MFHPKLASALAVLCLTGFAGPALAGSPYGGAQVIPGMGPEAGTETQPAPSRAEPGRYGGGFIEFLMTGNSTEAGPLAMPRRRPVPARYMASAGPIEPQYASPYGEPDYGQPGAAPAGYEMPRKAPDPAFQRQEVAYDGHQAPGTIVIDTASKFLYLVEGEGRALRYGIGVGRPGFLWQGQKTITRKAEWPDWTPPSEMLKRRPDLPSHMEGGIANPLGARAMYLGSTLYRIHGTNEPDTIGTNVSSGCIRLTNEDVADLFDRVRVGTKVIVL